MKGNKNMRNLIVLLVIFVIFGSALFLVKRKQKVLANAPKYGIRPTPVRVVPARKGDFLEKRDYLSLVEPIREADISARVTATVEKVLHDENDLVKKGDVLVILDGRAQRENISEVRARIEEARADLASNRATVLSLEKTVAYWSREAKRDKTLADKGAIPGAQAEGTADKANEAIGKLSSARKKSDSIAHLIASLQHKQAGLKTALSYCTLRSPFDGIVKERMVDPGDMAVPGKYLMVVEDRSELKLSFDVPQEDLPRVKVGLDVLIHVEGETRIARLSHLYPSLNRARMLRAEVNLFEKNRYNLSPGAYIPISLVVAKMQDVTLVPSSCIVNSPEGRPEVFVVIKNRIKARQVTVRGANGDLVAIEGVKPGELIVKNTFLGWAQLSSGLKIEAIQ